MHFDPSAGATGSRASPEAPLKELGEKSRQTVVLAERSLNFQQEVSVASARPPEGLRRSFLVHL